MCGIVGALSFKNSSFSITRPYIEKMRDTMEHRGPDGAGCWISENHKIGFGHRRLSIIDLSENAAQPMTNEDASIVITFNGEIYNHHDIRNEINSIRTFKWKTDHSDTEVILRAYEIWGIDCIHKFRGMFGLAIWDNNSKNLWLIRDRIGVKPVYYSIHNGRITFASEIKALLEDPGQIREVNYEAFYHYLSFLTTPAPNTLFKGIKKLEAGTWLRVNFDGSIKEHRYWDVWDHTSPMTSKSEDEIASLLIDELRTAVKLRKVADVPVGVFLSGGIDSSTNAALFSEGSKEPIKTFSIGYEGEYQSYKNELHFAQKMAKLVGADHHELKLNQDHLFKFLPLMIHLQDEPIADPVCMPVYYVSKLARDNNVIVCQVGEGSDELFWGYDSWKIKLKLQQANDWPIPNIFKNIGLGVMKALNKEKSLQYEFLRRGANHQPIFWGGAEAFTEAEKQALLSPFLRKKLTGLTSWQALEPIYKRFKERAWETSHLNWMSYLDLNLRLPELLLMRVDKMSMGVSLEGRVPFLDYKFVELAMSIPEAIKTKKGISKYILKKAVRGIIPDELIDRKKQGFGVPVYEWYFDKLGDESRKTIRNFCKETEFFDAKAIEQLLKGSNGPKVWYILNFALWWKHFIKGEKLADLDELLAESIPKRSGAIAKQIIKDNPFSSPNGIGNIIDHTPRLPL